MNCSYYKDKTLKSIVISWSEIWSDPRPEIFKWSETQVFWSVAPLHNTKIRVNKSVHLSRSTVKSQSLSDAGKKESLIDCAQQLNRSFTLLRLGAQQWYTELLSLANIEYKKAIDLLESRLGTNCFINNNFTSEALRFREKLLCIPVFALFSHYYCISPPTFYCSCSSALSPPLLQWVSSPPCPWLGCIGTYCRAKR